MRAVSQYMTNLDEKHWNVVKKILRYIKGTSDAGLCYRGSYFTIRDYVDSNFTGDLDNKKSIIGCVFTFVGGAISCVSKLQTVMVYIQQKQITWRLHKLARKLYGLKGYWRSLGINKRRLLFFMRVKVLCILQIIQLFIQK